MISDHPDQQVQKDWCLYSWSALQMCPDAIALLILCDHLLLDSSPEDSDTDEDADAIQKYAMSSAMARRMPSTPGRARGETTPIPAVKDQQTDGAYSLCEAWHSNGIPYPI